MICGVEANTENFREERPVKFWRNDEETKALAWRDEIGPNGVGPAFSETNGHRIVRNIYKMPVTFRRSANITPAYVSLEGSLIR